MNTKFAISSSDITAEAIQLVGYISTIKDFSINEPGVYPYGDHLGAVFTDAILQAGLNYRNVVKPRVENVLARFPQAKTVYAFSEVLRLHGVKEVIDVNNAAKIQTMKDLVSFCACRSIETTSNLADFLQSELGETQLKVIKGIGHKTCDYIKLLIGIDTVAVDRRIRSFIEQADIVLSDYFEIKRVVECAAEMMHTTCRSLDHSIWSYMSDKNTKRISCFHK